MYRRTLAGALCGLLAVGCSGGQAPPPAGRPVSQADYDRIERGMTRAQVEAALGPGAPATIDDLAPLPPPGLHAPGVEHRRQVLAQLDLVKWGSGDDWVYAGFEPGGTVRVRSMSLAGGPEKTGGFEMFGGYAVVADGKAKLLDDPPEAAPPAAPKTAPKAASTASLPKRPAPKPKATPTAPKKTPPAAGSPTPPGVTEVDAIQLSNDYAFGGRDRADTKYKGNRYALDPRVLLFDTDSRGRPVLLGTASPNGVQRGVPDFVFRLKPGAEKAVADRQKGDHVSVEGTLAGVIDYVVPKDESAGITIPGLSAGVTRLSAAGAGGLSARKYGIEFVECTVAPFKLLGADGRPRVTLDKFAGLLIGKDADAVRRLVGTPARTGKADFPGGELWTYRGVTRDPKTGKVQPGVVVVFGGEKVRNVRPE